MKRKFHYFLTFMALLCIQGMIAQNKTVTGTVTDASDDSPLPGANVLVQGTTTGAQTDFDGNYSIQASEGDVLIFTYIGMKSQTATVGSSDTINIFMAEDASQLDEVVVTALGITRKKKSLTYAAEIVSTEELTEARSLNVLDGISGKVSGISVTRTGGGVGAESKVLLRGNRSINGSSQPLYVVDGVPMNSDISNISPDDIESITVLKGANAAALYGSRANNGVIVVTTKLGKIGGKAFSIDINTGYTMATPIYLNNFQNEYGQGFDGVYLQGANRSWGPQFDGSSVAHWSNDPEFPSATTTYSGNPNNKTSDFFRTGHVTATNVGVTTNSETTNAYFSYTFTDAGGIVPGNDLSSNNFNIRIRSKLLDKLTLDTKLNYIREETDYALEGGEGYQNPIRALYKVPSNIKSEDAKQFEFTDAGGLVKQHFWTPNNNAPGNPYWNLNNIVNDIVEERVIGLVSLGYEITPNLNLLVRTSLDRFNFTQQYRWSTDSYIIADNGWYRVVDRKGFEWNSDFLLNYNNTFSDDFSLNASVGGNIRKNENSRVTVNPSRSNSLNVPNLFSLGNTSVIGASEAFAQKEVHSLYGVATFGYKDAIFLDVTARNDWSSALTSENRSFFYPSVGLTVVASDLMESTPDWLSLFKLRGSYAEVGNDTNPYQTVRAARITGGGNNGFLQPSTTIPNENLLPESTTSTEIGLDARFFGNRLGVDFTYYKSNSRDQLFSVSLPIASGATSLFVNGADIENKGVELTLTGSPIRTQNFNWDVTFNFAKNTSEVLEIAEGLDELNIGGASFLSQFKLVVGNPFGDIYSRGFARDEQGRVLVGDDGIPKVTSGLDVQVGNFNPDWMGGIRNSFTYKNLNLSFLIDIRQGGTIVNNTNAIMFADGQTEETLIGRGGGLIFGDNFFPGEIAVQENGGAANTVGTNAEKMWSALGGRNAPVGEAFTSDASNVRLRELILGYSVPQSIIDHTGLNSVKLSLVGRNLFFFSNKAGNVDPEVFASTATNRQGLQQFGPPTQREIGLNIKFGF